MSKRIKIFLTSLCVLSINSTIFFLLLSIYLSFFLLSLLTNLSGVENPGVVAGEHHYPISIYTLSLYIYLSGFENPGVALPESIITWVAIRGMPEFMQNLRYLVALPLCVVSILFFNPIWGLSPGSRLLMKRYFSSRPLPPFFLVVRPLMLLLFRMACIKLRNAEQSTTPLPVQNNR